MALDQALAVRACATFSGGMPCLSTDASCLRNSGEPVWSSRRRYAARRPQNSCLSVSADSASLKFMALGNLRQSIIVVTC